MKTTIAQQTAPMRNAAWLAALLMLVLFAHLTWAQTQNVHYTVDIDGAGNHAALLNTHLDIQRHPENAALNQEEWQRLVSATPRQIQTLLATEGYFSPTVQYTLRQEGLQWIARFHVHLGEPTRITTCDLHFTGDIAEGLQADPQRIHDLQRRWALQPGHLFRQTVWNDAKNATLKNLLDHDYPAAKIVHSTAQIDPDTHNAALSLDIDSGPRFTFGALQIHGLTRYSREVIDRVNPIQIGEPFSQEKLTELQVRLQDSGYFRSVFATIDIDSPQSQETPIRLDLTENERHRLALGMGFSTDTGARAQVKWLDRRFLGHDWRLESTFRLDRQTQVVGGDLYFPALGSGWHPSLGAHYERTDIANEVNDKIRLDARLTSPSKTDEETWGTAYLAEKQSIADTLTNHRQAWIASYTYTRRRLDNLITPQRGMVTAIDFSGGVRGLLNEANFARVVGRINWLSPIAQRWQMVMRGQLGQVLGASREAIPGDLLFRTGGDQSVRGYAFNSLGVEQNGAIVGGRTLAVFSAELVYQITPAWGAALFRDAGNAADSWHDFHLLQASGIGARWRSPIGPVNIDLAYGHASHQPRLHFSVGYGF